jgi:hypothetical protein
MIAKRLSPWILSLALGGCAGQQQVHAAGGGTTLVPSDLLDAVTFDHGCPSHRIVVLREAPAALNGAPALTVLALDLDVCGRVRRYKEFGAGRESVSTWLDVTALYPPDSLAPAATAR